MSYAQQQIDKLKQKLADKRCAKDKVRTIGGRKYRPVQRETPYELPSQKSAGSPLFPLFSVAKKAGRVGSVFATVRRVSWLNKKLKFQLGMPVASHISLVHIDTDYAVILADSPAWAQRSRFLQTDILLFLNRYCGDTLDKIVVQTDRRQT